MAKTFSQTKGGGGASIGGPITGGTAGSILFVNPSGTIAQDNANLFYDSTNHSLNIGTLSAVSSTARKVIELNAGGYGEPNAFNVASDGDKIILYRSAAAAYDGSIGVGSLSDMWFKSSGNAAGAGQFKWFTGIGTFVAMVLSGTGDLSVPASFTSASVNTTTINASTINTNAIISSGSGIFQATLYGAATGSYGGAYIRSVASSAVGYIGLSDSTAGNFYFRDALCVGTQNAFPFRINTNDTARVTVDATGKVGIGTIAPASQLHVLANYADIRVDTISAGDPTISFSQVGVLKWSLYNQVSGNILGFYDWTNSSFRFVVQPGTGQALTVLANNNVGVGTTTPISPLDVTGNIRSSALTASLLVGTDVNKNLNSITLGTGLSFSGTTLNTGAFVLPVAATGSVGTAASPQAIVVNYPYAYVAVNSSIQIFDVTVRSAPVLISTTTADTNVKYLSIQGSTLFSIGDANVQVWDVSNPSVLVLVGTSGTGGKPSTGLVASGRFVYFTSYKTLDDSYTISVIDITTPPSYNISSGSSTGIKPTAVAINQEHLFTADQDSNILTIYNASYPLITSVAFNPISSLAINTNVVSMTVEGGHAYLVSNGSPGKLQIIDISNVLIPISIASINLDNGTTIVKKQGDYVYVINNISNTMQAIDVSTPASPTIVGTWATGTAPTGLDIVGRYAYITNATSATMQVFNLGGSYIQQLETGSLETSQINVKGTSYLSELTVSGGANISGSMTIQNDFASLGNSGIGGILSSGGAAVRQLSAPVIKSVSTVGATGVATYGYKVLARNTTSSFGGNTQLSVEVTITNGNDDLSGSNGNLIKWEKVAGANQYIIYRTTATGAITNTTGRIAQIGSSVDGTPNGNLYSYIDKDTGASSITGATTINTTGTATFANTISLVNTNALLGGSTNSTTGKFLNIGAITWKDTGTATNGTASTNSFNIFGIPTQTAYNTGVKLTNAYNVNILGAPVASTNQTIINSTAFNIASSVVSATTTNSYGLQVNAMTGATNNYAANFNGKVLHQAPINLKNYTVATLPAGVQGDIAYVTDALTPGFLVAVVGGGTVVSPVFYNGTNWVAY
jgi:hypothetical protein